MKDFVPDFEDVLQFLKTLKHDTLLFGEYNIDIIKDSKDNSDYESLIATYCFKRQNLQHTRVTETSSTCLDDLLTSFPVKHEQLKQPSVIITQLLVNYI